MQHDTKVIRGKEYIVDDGKIRRCDSNIAKMSVAEYTYYYIFQWGVFQEIIVYYIWDSLKKFSAYFVAFLMNVLELIISPIAIPIIGYRRIKEAKRVVEENNARRAKLAKMKAERQE